jgi:cold shock protein
MLGTVLWYSELKSCGFITPDGQSENIFVHYTALKNENGRRILNKADRVTFEIGEHKGKPVAVNVQRIKADLPTSTSLSEKTEVENGRN